MKKTPLNKQDTLRRFFAICAVIYAVIGFGANLVGWISLDSLWHVASSDLLPEPYTYNRLLSIAPPGGAPIGYTPLLMWLTYPFILIGRVWQFSLSQMAILYKVVLVSSDILTVALILRMGERLGKKMPVWLAKILVLQLFFSGYFWHASFYIGHPESLVLLLTLLSTYLVLWRELPAITNKMLSVNQALVISGIFLGLALGAKQTAIFAAIPLAIWAFFKYESPRPHGRGIFSLRFFGSEIPPKRKFSLSSTSLRSWFFAKGDKKHHGWLYFVFGTLLSFSAVVAPIVMRNWDSALYGLVGYTRTLRLQGPSVWWLLNALEKRFWQSALLAPYFIRLANFFVIAAAIAVSLIYVKKKKFALREQDIFGLLTLCWLIYTLFGKWISFHHYLPLVGIFLLWERSLVRHEFPAVWAVYTSCILAAYFIGLPLWQVVVVVINSAAFVYVWREATS